MKRNIRLIAFVLFALIALTTRQSSAPAFAQSGGEYELAWSSVDSGGATFSSGGTYSLGGTIGQADAGTLNGGAYTLIGGLWADFLESRLYLPLIMR